MSIHNVAAPAAGVVLKSVLSADRSPVTVYSNAGLSTAVTLPLTLGGVTTVYVPNVPEWRARVTTPDGLLEPWVGSGSGAATLTFVVDTPSRHDIDGGSA